VKKDVPIKFFEGQKVQQWAKVALQWCVRKTKSLFLYYLSSSSYYYYFISLLVIYLLGNGG